MDHAATLRRCYELINAGDVDGFGDLLADDFVEHEETPGLAPTKDGVMAFFRMYIAAFPDLRMDPEDVLASGDKVVARVRVTGTHQGEFMGMPATGKSIDVQLIDIIALRRRRSRARALGRLRRDGDDAAARCRARRRSCLDLFAGGARERRGRQTADDRPLAGSRPVTRAQRESRARAPRSGRRARPGSGAAGRPRRGCRSRRGL